MQRKLIMFKAFLFIFLFISCSKDTLNPEDSESELLTYNTFYVAPFPDGDNSNPGTKDKPWATWDKAFNSPLVKPGDIVFFRGGVYYHTFKYGGYGYRCSKRGTSEKYIHFFNYMNETPILDCDSIVPAKTLNLPLYMGEMDYVHFKGLHIRNVWQTDGEDEVTAWTIGNSSNTIVERCVIYNTHGKGFKADNCNELYYINCDSYNNCDSLTTVPAHNPVPGNDGSGFQDFNWTSSESKVYYKNCRAWNCGDQGFAGSSDGYTEYDGCWSFNNGQLEGGGHGFKMGRVKNVLPDRLHRLYKNCLATYNRQYGFNTNDQGHECGALHVYNNTSFHNGYREEWTRPTSGFYIYNTKDSDDRELLRVYKNNLSYKNESNDVVVGTDGIYSHEYNSWDTPPGVNITDAFFISTDSSGLSGPRQADGSLPEIDFLKLAPGSPAIDAGTTFTGLPYKGKSPDLGAFEYGL